MYSVYILKNNLTGRHYIGSTNNLERRISEHNRGQNKSTRSIGVWQLIYLENFSSSTEAKNKERKIKSFKGGNAFKKLIM
jgi:putative endonuclease